MEFLLLSHKRLCTGHFGIRFSRVHPKAVADLRGGARDACPPPRSKFFHFYAVFGKNSTKIKGWCTLLGNSGSAIEAELHPSHDKSRGLSRNFEPSTEN